MSCDGTFVRHFFSFFLTFIGQTKGLQGNKCVTDSFVPPFSPPSPTLFQIRERSSTLIERN
jgi:hypothetical protein